MVLDNYTTDPRDREDMSPAAGGPTNGSGACRRRSSRPPRWTCCGTRARRTRASWHRAGVDVTATRYNGLIHDYGLLNPISRVPGVRSALLHAGTELKERLS